MKRMFLCAALACASFASLAAEPAFTPALFVDQVAQDGMLEVELGKLALRKSGTPAVQEFARRTIDHRDRMNAELKLIAVSRGIETSAKLDSMREALVRALDTEEGASFDHVYARRMRVDQARTIALFEEAAKSSDPEVARFASDALPMLKENDALARRLVKLSR